MFDAKNLNIQWTEGEVPGTTYGLSDSSWMDNILMNQELQLLQLKTYGLSDSGWMDNILMNQELQLLQLKTLY